MEEAAITRVPRKGIQSIEIGARLLDALIDERGPLRLKHLAERASLTPSKARMYLVSLIRTGLIEQDDRTGLYAPGPTAIRLGVIALGQDRMLGSARRLVETLGRDTGNLVLLSGWDGSAPVVLATSEHSDALPIAFKVGARVPLWTSATGTMAIAHLPTPVVEILFESCPPGDAVAVRESIFAARRDGHVWFDRVRLTDSATIQGYAALATPIVNATGALEYVVTMLVAGEVPRDAQSIPGAALLLERVARFNERHG